MSLLQACHFSCLPQPLLAVLPNRLQEAIASLTLTFFYHDQGFVHEACEYIQDLSLVDPLVRADRLCCFQGTSPGKDREPPEQDALLLRQQGIRPVHRGT